ncbi:MAG: DUF4382 domain-containing protein [Anaerolineae bacterium]
MKKIVLTILMLFALSITLVACGGGRGTLQFHANGEDFVRQGFVSKDGWAITFDNVYITLSDVKSYQSDPPYDAHSGGKVNAKKEVSLTGTHTVDLAEGGEDAEPILVGEVPDAPEGRYHAIHWKMVKAEGGPADGYSLVISGTAEKEGKEVKFTIKVENEYEYTCGEYVGEERKGILQKGGKADQEMTFHFDHLFGDAETPPDDALNLGAPGFEMFAALAEGGKLDIDMAGLKSRLAPENYKKLEDILPTLGHTGEGHCHCEYQGGV